MIKKIISITTALLLFVGASTVSGEKMKETETTTLPSIEYCGAVYPLSHNEYTEICEVVMAEAGGESFVGQQAVAQCILNACLRDKIRPLEAIKEYGYTSNRVEPSESVKQAVLSIFTDGEKVLPENALYFYAPKHSRGRWHNTQKFIREIGGHRFYAPLTD